MTELIAGIVVGLGVAMSAWAAIRRRASTRKLIDGARFLPVPRDVQERIRQLVQDGMVADAVTAVSQQRGAGLAESKAIVDRLRAGGSQSSSYEESARLLRQEHPEVARAVAEQAASGMLEEAMQQLRKRIGIGLIPARDLVTTLARDQQ
jgi:hypothetical protein